ncbi:MAG TPA: PIG-L family deacetylase [Acidimicrobiia bacterium]|nr:PIG-L family deacetylase [Acidimicrobiia bacterium]
MPGLLAFHAHPDDETIAMGGTMAKYASAGKPVVVVTATDGALGEVHNYDDPGPIKERLAEVRAEEIRAALDILGVKDHEFLGYRDSGMMGWETNHHPNCFWQADHQEAARRLVSLIRKYRPEVMTIYDPHGGYGHPDHINVHRIGIDAFYASDDEMRFPLSKGEEGWRPAKLYMTARPRTRMAAWAEMRLSEGSIDAETAERMRQSGVPDDLVTCLVDVREYIETKLNALRAHRTQIPPDWPMLTVPEDRKDEVLGREAFVRVFGPTGAVETDLFEGIAAV